MMEEIKIIKAQLKILRKKGITLDYVDDTICFVNNKLLEKTIKNHNESQRKWNGLSKDVENYDIIDSSKYIVDSID